MHPSFPSSTFPNHWTLATGLYPEAHGIVGNTFYDPVLKEEFMYNKEEVTNKTQWWGGEPIWVTAALQGLRTAVDMWPGSTASVHHVRSNFLVKFNETVSPHEKMDTVLKWIDKPTEERPQLIAVYVPQVDTVGHKNGPVSLEMNSTIIEVDTAIGYLIKGLEDRNIDTHIHVVIMSDHGMTSTGASKRIYYDDILSPTVLSSLREPEASPLLNLRPSTNISSDSLLKSVYHELKNYTQHVANPHFKVYLKEEVPMRYHYRASQRIAPIVAIPDPGYLFSLHEDINRSKQHEVFRTVGSHGYDNLFPDMRAIFLAQGPKILRRYGRGSVIAPFFNTEVYEFITDLLNIPSAPNNGTLGGEFFRVSRG
ncbi:alkaline-phosphatase-like protein [Spinellus fusiger]|nr:alkaline-phosphatase-like protein [Spinellus fusiger]